MGNIKNIYFNNLDLKLSDSDYWDFFLANDDSPIIYTDYDACLLSSFDFNNPNIYTSGSTTISSLATWTGATNTGYSFNTIGLTGIDNGLVTYNPISGDTSNLVLLSALTGNTLVIPANDYRLHLNPVTGSTGQYIYPIHILSLNGQTHAQFCGGFYQGYTQIEGSTYQVLPNRTNNGWVAEFNLKVTDDYCFDSGTTLNNTYPNNKGFFFYMGTRAENKFWNRFDGADTGCTSGCTTNTGCTDTLSPWCTTIKETDITISGKSGNTITLYPNQVDVELVTNPFLLYGAATGSNVCGNCGSSLGSGLGNQWTYGNSIASPVTITTPKTIITNTTNPFLVYGSANGICNACGYIQPSGYGNQTVCSFSGFETSIQFDNLDYTLDIQDNALGFRITDDGRIGYRMLTVTGMCSGDTTVTGFTVEEGYSEPNLITPQVWTNIMIRFSTEYYDVCDLKEKPRRTGKLFFYINGKLKYTVNNFNEFIGRKLNDYMEKQIGVPYNISLGGGTQGLIETQTFDGRDLGDLGLPIEQNFAGTFIGAISEFSFYGCDLYYSDIYNIYNT